MADRTTETTDDRMADLEERRAEERRPVEEAGGGESEGFEATEQELIDHASHGDQHSTEPILRDASDVDEELEEVAGEADELDSPDD